MLLNKKSSVIIILVIVLIVFTETSKAASLNIKQHNGLVANAYNSLQLADNVDYKNDPNLVNPEAANTLLKPNVATPTKSNAGSTLLQPNVATNIHNPTNSSVSLGSANDYQNDPNLVNPDGATSLLKPTVNKTSNDKANSNTVKATAAAKDDDSSNDDPKPETDAQIDEQLEDYSVITHWMVENKANFDKVLQDTAKATKTKWIVDETSTNPNSNSSENTANMPSNTTNADNNGDSNSNGNLYHLVKSKETLFSIAKLYGVTTNDLIKLNNLANNDIKIGQKLLIRTDNSSGADVPSSSVASNFNYPKYKYYKVQVGDTLISIGRQFSMSDQEIISLNNMSNSRIYPSMVLKVNAKYNEEQEQRDTKFNWPLVGRLLVGFGPQKSGIVNEGINILSKKGNPVKSVGDGVVIYVGSGLKGFGNLILVQHPNHWISVYAHIENITVTKGEIVKQGQIIASVAGDKFKVPQLHFELRKDVTPKDPLDYLNSYT